MPLACPNDEKPRYRVDKHGTRLAFCGNKVVEAKPRAGKARPVKQRPRKR